MKKNVTLILIISAVIVGLLVGLGYFYNKNKAPNNNEHYESNNCIKKGSICTAEDILKGIKVEVQVNENTKKEFFVISNDENTMTLIQNDNIVDKADWYWFFFKHQFGPVNAFQELVKATSTWTNIEPIKSYTYEDYGHKQFLEVCEDLTNSDPAYDCTFDSELSRGYIKYEIVNGDGYVYNNPSIDVGFAYSEIGIDKLRARLVSVEEINDVTLEELPSWLGSNLKDKECYWTSSSSIVYLTNYNEGAYAICNKDKTITIEPAFSKEEARYKVGIRPVIVINKEQ